jgi:hypothetical protein
MVEHEVLSLSFSASTTSETMECSATSSRQLGMQALWFAHVTTAQEEPFRFQSPLSSFGLAEF